LQGKSVVKALVKSGKYRVRGVSRQDPSSEKVKPLRDLGAEPFQADQKNKDQVIAACKGAYAVYSVSISWPMASTRLSVLLFSTLEIFDNLIHVCSVLKGSRKQVEDFLFSSL
jgi:hypothetical protein